MLCNLFFLLYRRKRKRKVALKKVYFKDETKIWITFLFPTNMVEGKRKDLKLKDLDQMNSYYYYLDLSPIV